MTLDTATLDRIKQAAASTLAEVMGNEGIPVAARVLDAIDQAVADPTTPEPFPVGQVVTSKISGARGVIMRRVQHHGELHTVIVQWEGATEQVAVGPRELRVVA